MARHVSLVPAGGLLLGLIVGFYELAKRSCGEPESEAMMLVRWLTIGSVVAAALLCGRWLQASGRVWLGMVGPLVVVNVDVDPDGADLSRGSRAVDAR